MFNRNTQKTLDGTLIFVGFLFIVYDFWMGDFPMLSYLGAPMFLVFTYSYFRSSKKWQEVLKKYPAPPNFQGKKNHIVSATINGYNPDVVLTMGADQGGLYISPWIPSCFYNHPIYIPWKAMKKIEKDGEIGGVLYTVKIEVEFGDKSIFLDAPWDIIKEVKEKYKLKLPLDWE